MKREEKEREIEFLRDSLGQAKSLILVDYRGLKVNQVNELRKKVSNVSKYRVIKNRLALRALADFYNKDILKHIKGPTAVFYSDGDPISLSKTLMEFAKDNPGLEFKAGLIEQTAITPEEIRELAKTPGKNELISKLLFILNYPLTKLVMVLSADQRGLACALDQIRRSREEK